MVCIKCGREIGENDAFCPGCGTKQAKTYKEVFVRHGLKEEDFISNINKWFQWHPKAANISCKFGLTTSLGFLANKYQLDQFVIEYELFEKDNQYQYGLTKEESMAFVQKDHNEAIGKWQADHPNVKVVSWKGGTHSRGDAASLALGGFGAANRMNLYILFKFPKNK